jgi:predicted TIM-barrel fold metal-dependent hydrolase
MTTSELDADLFLPEPEPREVKYTIISVDDHLVEPADMFEGRLPAKLQDQAPKIVLNEQGHEVWEFEGQRHYQVGQNAVAGRRLETVQVEPFRFDQMRPGCYDVHARVRDMDVNGVWASLNFPSIFSEYWEPVIAACAETDTVISLHVGSSGMADYADDAPRLQLGATLFGQLSLTACAEWLWSGWAVKYPGLKVAMSEGGIGWVAMLVDRLDNIIDRSGYGMAGFKGLRPADVLRDHFWFCTIDDPSTIDTRHTIGIDHIMLETDYPHGDGTWPDTQAVVEKFWGHFPVDELRKLTHQNAAALFRHPLPDVCLP